jgi:hypothetical protein
MDSIELSPRDSELSVEVSVHKLHEEIGEQGILGDTDGNTDHYYLAGLALECAEDENGIVDVLDEFIRNASDLEHVSNEAADRIEDLLR